MKYLLFSLSLVGFVGCDESHRANSTSSTSPSSVGQPAETDAAAGPKHEASNGKEHFAKTNLEGVYVGNTAHLQDYFGKVTGESGHLWHILSDKPLAFSTFEGDADPKWAVGEGFSEFSKSGHHQYLVYSTNTFAGSQNEGDTADFSVSITEIQVDDLTVEKALLMSPVEVLEEAGLSVRRSKNYQVTIPAVDKGLVESAATDTGKYKVLEGVVSSGWQTGPDNESVTLLVIGRRVIPLTTEGRLNGVGVMQPFVSLELRATDPEVEDGSP